MIIETILICNQMTICPELDMNQVKKAEHFLEEVMETDVTFNVYRLPWRVDGDYTGDWLAYDTAYIRDVYDIPTNNTVMFVIPYHDYFYGRSSIFEGSGSFILNVQDRPADRVDPIAKTIAHEFLHNAGLRHTCDIPSYEWYQHQYPDTYDFRYKIDYSDHVDCVYENSLNLMNNYSCFEPVPIEDCYVDVRHTFSEVEYYMYNWFWEGKHDHQEEIPPYSDELKELPVEN